MRLIFLLPSFPILMTGRNILWDLVNLYKDDKTPSTYIYVICSITGMREAELNGKDAISTQNLFKPEVGLRFKSQIMESRK